MATIGGALSVNGYHGYHSEILSMKGYHGGIVEQGHVLCVASEVDVQFAVSETTDQLLLTGPQ